ncbi:MAG: GNAT family N-acetyltransferase [Acidimicrobiia bacterium]|nr:GNAT family N-acetyltransferase [Acidimicrobiia bacterium]
MRLGPWRGRDDVAHLMVGALQPPTSENVARCLGLLRRKGYRSVVTSALGPAESLPFVDAGFSVRERLRLLSHDLDSIPSVRHESRRGRVADQAAVLALDHRSFRLFWQFDEDGMGSALGATAAVRYRVVTVDGNQPVAYAITGRASRQGYLQRIAVDPGHQGLGIGRSIVADALRWLRRHRATGALVNTQCDNAPALALYQSCGFSELPTGLCVMGRSL